MSGSFPDPSVRRLSAYLRQLEHLSARDVEHVSSRQLAEYIKVGAAQVRRDLALFGQFGVQGLGYSVSDLVNRLRHILSTHEPWRVVLVGVGKLSRALLRYPGFRQRGFEIVAAFDIDPTKINQSVGDIPIRHVDELESIVKERDARLAILAVPPDAAQEVAGRLARTGIEGIMNFSTPVLEAPSGVYVNYVDISAHLEQLSFQISNSRP